MESKAWSFARRTAQPFVFMGVQAGISGAKILKSLRGQGIGYRETDFYQDWRMYNQYRLNEARIARLRPETAIPESWIIQSPLAHVKRYRYDFKTVFQDVETGELIPTSRSFAHDKYMTPGQALDYIDTDVPWEISEPDLTYVSSHLKAVLHRADDPFP